MTKTALTDWLKFADDDLIAADALMERELFHLACFHAQQAAEKALKAAIISLGQSPPKTHVLRELYITVSKAVPDVSPYLSSLIVLDKYYIPTRYPDALPGSLPEGLPDKDQTVEAIRVSNDLVSFIKSHITT